MGNTIRLGISRATLALNSCCTRRSKRQKNINILICGVANTGKSIIALRLSKFRKSIPDLAYIPSVGYNTFVNKSPSCHVRLMDIGGNPSIREIWNHYYCDSHGFIYVVDTSNRESIQESATVLEELLNDRRVQGKPLLILGNKHDMPESIDEDELVSALQLVTVVNQAKSFTRVELTSAIDRELDKHMFIGYNWLINYIKRHYNELNERVIHETLEEKDREKLRRQQAWEFSQEKDSDEMKAEGDSEVHETTPVTASSARPYSNVVASTNRVTPKPIIADPNENSIQVQPDVLPEISKTAQSKIISQPRSNSGKSLARLSPEGADSDDGIINNGFDASDEPALMHSRLSSAKISTDASDSPKTQVYREKRIQVPAEIIMVTTLAQVHDNKISKERRNSTSTHEGSVTMSATSLRSEEADVGWEDVLGSKPSSSNAKDKPTKKSSSRNNKVAPISLPMTVSTVESTINDFDRMNKNTSGKQYARRRSLAGVTMPVFTPNRNDEKV